MLYFKKKLTCTYIYSFWKLVKQPLKFNRNIWHAQSLATVATDIASLDPPHINLLEVYCSVTVFLKIYTVNLLGSVKTRSHN
jgi:hypothetical protein